MAIDFKKVTPEGKERLRMLGRVVAVPKKLERASARDHVALFRKVTNLPDGMGVKDTKGKVRIIPAAARPSSPRRVAHRGGR
jgi:hypothetical protein